MTSDKEVIQKINELYVMGREKFLVMNNKGYFTVENKPEKKLLLTDVYIARHLQRKETIGVFAGKNCTKFICFDVDIKNPESAKWVVYKLVNTLQNIGFNGEDIHISVSGGKGYHVELFFEKPISNGNAELLYNHTICVGELDKDNLQGIGKVEFRPTATQGVKIPSGKHFGTGNVCWYCDFVRGLKPIESTRYLLKIKPIKQSTINNIIDEIKDVTFTKDELLDIKYVKNNFKPPIQYYENADKGITIATIEELIHNGLQIEGTRHNSLLKIAKYYKYCGMSPQENIEALISWLKEQRKEYYKTSWQDCLLDIKGIIEWAYSKNIHLTINRKITISDCEMKQILKPKGKNNKLLLFTLLLHKKRYADKKGVFFMAYSKMIELTGLTEKTVITCIKKLEAENLIDVIRDKKKILIDGKWRQSTNNYKVNVLEANKGNQIYEIVLDSSDNQLSSFKDCIVSLIPNLELKRLLTRREYESLVA